MASGLEETDHIWLLLMVSWSNLLPQRSLSQWPFLIYVKFLR